MVPMEWIASPEAWIALLTLTVLELVLGIDNIIFISILSGRLPEHQRARARTLGLAAAMIMRILLLFSLSWLSRLTVPLFEVFGIAFTGRSLVFLVGGLFLLYKATQEIHQRLEGSEEHADASAKPPSLGSVLVQIALLDIVFSLDSVITAVGMADQLAVMVIAVVAAVLLMMVAAGPIANFVERHPTVKMLALSFLLLIGMTLIADAFGQHVPKGYIYFAMGFSVLVEFLNQWAARNRAKNGTSEPVTLKPRFPEQRHADEVTEG